MGLKIIMCTGDNRRTAESVARELGIDEFRAEVMPDEKIEIVKRLKASGAIVAMAGDGINDAPALAAADVGIAMGTGTDVAIESASITLVKGDLMGIVKAMHLSRAVMRNIRQNLFFAFIYNALGVPIAAGILYPLFGILLSPMIAGAAMSFSSVSVIANALRLRSDQIVAASLCEARLFDRSSPVRCPNAARRAAATGKRSSLPLQPSSGNFSLPMTTRLAIAVFVALLLHRLCRSSPRNIQELHSNPNRNNCRRQQKALLKLR